MKCGQEFHLHFCILYSLHFLILIVYLFYFKCVYHLWLFLSEVKSCVLCSCLCVSFVLNRPTQRYIEEIMFLWDLSCLISHNVLGKVNFSLPSTISLFPLHELYPITLYQEWEYSNVKKLFLQ